MRIALLIILAGISYALGIWANRGQQLRRLATGLLAVCAIAVTLALIDVASRLPAIMNANARTDTSPLFLEVAHNRPSIFLFWVAVLILAWLGFAGARFSPWLAVPVFALALFWSLELIGGFPDRNDPAKMSQTDRSYVKQVLLATTIAFLATGQGLRLWLRRYNKRVEQTPPEV